MYSFYGYELWLYLELIKRFNFPCFLENDLLLNAVQLITFLYFINIRNILTGCYILHYNKRKTNSYHITCT